MNITHQLLNNVAAIKAYDALTIGIKHNFGDLIDNIREYSNLLMEYKNKGIDRVAIICKDEFNYNTISLIFALMQCEITPVIINEKIGEQIPGILEKESIHIAFYESLMRPEYLKKYDITIDENNGDKIFVSVNPYINVKNKTKIKNMKWYLKYLATNSCEENICKIYDKENEGVTEDIVTQEDFENYNENFKTLPYEGRWQKGQTSIPLYEKEGFLYLTTALTRGMHIICLNEYDMEKNIMKILKTKPSVITIDKYMALELAVNPKFKDIDLSFAKKILIDVEPSYFVLVIDIISKSGFNGEYMRLVPEESFEKKYICQ